MLFALQSVSAGARDKSLASSSPEKKFTKMNRVLVVLATVLVLVSSSTEREKLITKQVLEQMLHIHPASGDDGALLQAPLYMMDLYKKYSQGQLSPTKANSNRITSLAPIKGQIHGIQVLMFNVSSLGSGVNEINLAEVHFYKKRQRGDRGRLKHQRGADYRVEAFILTGSSLTSVAKWKITTDSKAWQVFNVTEAVRRLSKPTSATSTQLIAFLFHKIKRSTKEYEYVNMESIVKMEPSPFLIVFSNETLPETVERSPGMSTANSTWDARPSDSVTAAETRSIGQEDQWQGALSRSGSRRRPSRSIHDNELPNADIYYKQIPRTNPGILEGRSSGRKKASKIATSNNRISYPTQPTFALTWPQHHKKKKNRKGKKKQQKKIIDSWPYNKQHVNDARFYSHEDIGKSLCRRHKLTVDFAQIGWGEWIISPKTFEAYYCAGSCPFPLTKELNPTNHATLQSIVHAIGQNPEVPAPCCVPNSLSSVTLLYFDDNKNVVLKNYPAMTADSCSCQ